MDELAHLLSVAFSQKARYCGVIDMKDTVGRPMTGFLSTLTRTQKSALWLGIDGAVVALALYMALALRYGTLAPGSVVDLPAPLFAYLVVSGMAVSLLTRLPWLRLHSLDIYALERIAMAAAVLTLIAIILSYLLNATTPRSVPLIFGALFFLGTIVSRILVLLILRVIFSDRRDAVPVAIYGAGMAGIQMVSALREAKEFTPQLFVDDNAAIHGSLISGLEVVGSSAVRDHVARGKIKQVIIAIPSISEQRRTALVKSLSDLGCPVKILPSYVDLIAGKGGADGLQPVNPEDLLQREKVDLDIPDVAKAYAGRVVMVTGAGGSIGSELCRQLVATNPAHIVLFESSEFALYSIHKDLEALTQDTPIGITARLGSVVDAGRVSEVMTDTGVDIVLHAAAYKHVPLVEENEIQGAQNNVLGTRTVAQAAAKHGVERFILVSTDKAVRPTNIMGATKRLAEQVIQTIAKRKTGTKFSLVRFGNVLGSSGSVIPLFAKQIRRGGPLTVTHPDVTRFFMTIPEAARLVLLAGAYAKGGDVFVLDMGQPVKIIDVARRMVALSGRSLRENGQEGDIEINITGLRPGEKLYEELLIDDDSLVATPHPKILRAQDTLVDAKAAAKMIAQLEDICAARDQGALRALVKTHVEGYHPPSDPPPGAPSSDHGGSKPTA